MAPRSFQTTLRSLFLVGTNFSGFLKIVDLAGINFSDFSLSNKIILALFISLLQLILIMVGT